MNSDYFVHVQFYILYEYITLKIKTFSRVFFPCVFRVMTFKTPLMTFIWLRATPSHLPREISTLIVAGVYHPPKASNESELIEHIAHTVTGVKIKHPGCRVVICGDFNKANIKPLSNKGVKQVVRAPTRGSNVLDLIITDMSKIYKQANIIPPIGKSDHSTVLWEPEISKLPQPASVSVTSRPMPDSAIRKFGQWITAYDWRPVLHRTKQPHFTTLCKIK